MNADEKRIHLFRRGHPLDEHAREIFQLACATTFTRDLCGDVAMHLHRHLHLAERLDRIDQLDLALVHLEPLRLERVRDVGGRHRSIHHVVLADAARDLDLELLQPLRVRLGGRALLRVADLGNFLLALDLLLVRLGHREGELARQQKVARVSGGDLDDFAAATEIVDVLSENDFHDVLT